MEPTSRDVPLTGSADNVSDLNKVFLVANFTNARSDLARVFPEGTDRNLLVFDTRTPPKDEGIEYLDLLDMVLDGRRNVQDIVIGPSVPLPFISELATGLINKDHHLEGVLSGISEFIINNVRNVPATTRSVVEKNEMLYFIFSSSLRSEIFRYIIDYYMDGRDIACLIDHGSAMGMIPLYLTHTYKGKIARVGCSELKKEYVSLGHMLWGRCGLEERISWQEVSASDFVYPKGVSVIIFAQMLYSIPREQRKALIESAWAALAPGGVLILNEIMNKPFHNYAVLTPDELVSYLPKEASPRFFWDFKDTKSALVGDVEASMFSRYDSTVALQKGEYDPSAQTQPSMLRRIWDRIVGEDSPR